MMRDIFNVEIKPGIFKLQSTRRDGNDLYSTFTDTFGGLWYFDIKQVNRKTSKVTFGPFVATILVTDRQDGAATVVQWKKGRAQFTAKIEVKPDYAPQELIDDLAGLAYGKPVTCERGTIDEFKTVFGSANRLFNQRYRNVGVGTKDESSVYNFAKCNITTFEVIVAFFNMTGWAPENIKANTVDLDRCTRRSVELNAASSTPSAHQIMADTKTLLDFIRRAQEEAPGLAKYEAALAEIRAAGSKQ